MILPLDGVRVIELGTFITGPAAGMLLADLGADVIKVERPGTGDPFRAHDGDLYSAPFQTYNRNKRSVTLDPKQPADLAQLDQLVADADVFIHNFRPGTEQRLNVGYDRLRKISPKLIYCAISGFGPDGRNAHRPAFDTVAQAASGFLRLLINPGNPRVVGPAIGDAITGYYAAYGILGALFRRSISGQGMMVETSMFEAMCHFNLDDFTHYFDHGEVMGPFSRPHVSQSFVFECADGNWVALHMSSPAKFWTGLARAVGMADMFDRPEFATRDARIANYEAVVATLAPRFRSRPLAYWVEILTQEDVPHAPVESSRSVVDGDLAKDLSIVVEDCQRTPHFRTIRSPLRFDGQAAKTVMAPPELGQHNAELLGHAGSFDADSRLSE